MSASRKGLKRDGLRGYKIGDGDKAIIIRKESPTDWRIRPATMPSAFFFERHTLLRNARRAAELLWKGKRGWDPILDLPEFLDRRTKK